MIRPNRLKTWDGLSCGPESSCLTWSPTGTGYPDSLTISPRMGCGLQPKYIFFVILFKSHI